MNRTEIFKPGMIVRYAPEWCSEGEQKYRAVILESYPDVKRCLIKLVNTNMVFAPTEVVDYEMIIYTGVTVDKKGV